MDEHLPLGVLRRTVREIGLGLITLGVVILLFVAYQLFGTDIAANASQASLKRSFQAQLQAPAHRTAPASATAPPTTTSGGDDASTVGASGALPSTPTAGALDHLVIPKIGLDKYVVDGTTESDLSKGPGHYLGTPYPGQRGDSAIAGHRTTYGAPFFRLNQLGVGDFIYLTDTSGHTYRYRVDQPYEVVPPSDVGVIGPTAAATLTLTTCNPPLSATSRLIVKATLVGLPAPTPVPTRATTVAPARAPAAPARPNLTGGNHSAWPSVVAWGAAVVGLWVATRLLVNRTRRWRRFGAYVVGIGVCSAPLWLCFENVVQLLPQSI